MAGGDRRTQIFKAEDTNFTAGETLTVLSPGVALAYNATRGYIAIDGNGNILIEFSHGPNDPYSDPITLKPGEVFDVEGLTIYNLRLTHTGTDSAYRIHLA